MSDISSNWKPLKYCLVGEFDFYNKKTKQRILKKAIKATGNGLENIALGRLKSWKLSVSNKKKTKKKRLSCYCVFGRQYLKHQEEIQEYSYSKFFARKTPIESIFTVKMNFWINSGVSRFTMLRRPGNMHQMRQVITKAGMVIEPGHYKHQKLKDAQINHFLDFLQYGGVMQGVTSGTRSVKYQLEGEQ